MSKKKIQFAVLVFLFLGVVLVFKAVFAFNHSSLIEVNFFDVGEGDSIMIKLPGNIQVLIDGGPSGSVVEQIAKEMPFFDREIELIILTHPDNDHIAGLFEVFKSFKVDKILMSDIEGKIKEKDLYLSFQEIVQEEGSEVIFAQQGKKISFLPVAGSSAEEIITPQIFILWPLQDLKTEEINDFSVVAKLNFGEMDFLFTGDISNKIEYQLLANNLTLDQIGDVNLQSEVIKIAHHGSKYSSNEYFLRAVSPEVAVISVGENHYGHPAPEVLDNLKKYGIIIYRTDESGNIKIISNGKNYQILTNQ
ncbi:MAG TPA: MBL fold metallo-hydrolase [Candidatus Pacearchaeota archaeon]|nr:MBL fold metallo-hydrolase [Candidatus Pacearchaeota archaeon]